MHKDCYKTAKLLTVAAFVVCLANCGEEPKKPELPKHKGYERQLATANHLYDVGRYDEAVNQYRAYLSSHPGHGDARTDLGTCYKKLGKLDLALSEYERVLAENPRHLQAKYNSDIVHILRGQRENARLLFQEIIALAPQSRVASAAQQRLAELDTRRSTND